MEQWVAEAEEGYDVDDLKKRGRAADPTHVVAVRLTTDELESLDRLAAERDLSRSELVRQAIAALTAARERQNLQLSMASALAMLFRLQRIPYGSKHWMMIRGSGENYVRLGFDTPCQTS